MDDLLSSLFIAGLKSDIAKLEADKFFLETELARERGHYQEMLQHYERMDAEREAELDALLAQLHSCGYTCEAGRLEDNVAWRELRELAGKDITQEKVT